MKLVELLAREWSEWPANCDYAVCDSDGEIRAIGAGTNNDFYPATAVDLEDRLNGTALLVSDDGKRVTRTDWAAERARIAKPAKKAGKDGWIRHRGGNCPVEKGTRVDVRFRNGDIVYGVPALERHESVHAYGWTANTEFWKKDNVSADIMAYRLHKPAEQVDDNADLKAAAYDAIQLLQWRDRITEIDSTTQALTAERAELVQKLASEGFALIGRMADPVEDMSDWRNWKVGDEVVYTSDMYENLYTTGKSYKVKSVDTSTVSVFDDLGGNSACCFDDSDVNKLRWVSRPSA